MEDKSDYAHRVVQLDVIDAERSMRLLQSPTDGQAVEYHVDFASRRARLQRNLQDQRPVGEQQPSQVYYQMHEALLHRTSSAESLLAARSSHGPKRPLLLGCDDPWRWSREHRSSEVAVNGPLGRTAFFHPNWSKGTAAVRGTRVLNNGRYYWEIHVTNRVFGTR